MSARDGRPTVESDELLLDALARGTGAVGDPAASLLSRIVLALDEAAPLGAGRRRRRVRRGVAWGAALGIAALTAVGGLSAAASDELAGSAPQLAGGVSDGFAPPGVAPEPQSATAVPTPRVPEPKAELRAVGPDAVPWPSVPWLSAPSRGEGRRPAAAPFGESAPTRWSLLDAGDTDQGSRRQGDASATDHSAAAAWWHSAAQRTSVLAYSRGGTGLRYSRFSSSAGLLGEAVHPRLPSRPGYPSYADPSRSEPSLLGQFSLLGLPSPAPDSAPASASASASAPAVWSPAPRPVPASPSASAPAQASAAASVSAPAPASSFVPLQAALQPAHRAGAASDAGHATTPASTGGSGAAQPSAPAQRSPEASARSGTAATVETDRTSAAGAQQALHPGR